MVSYVEALNLIWEKASGFERATEIVSLVQCVGRTLARDLSSDWSLPAFDTSAMDGFAVRTPLDIPCQLDVRGSIAAGDRVSHSDLEGTYEIMTGAPFPDGFDACVKQEDVARTGDSITLTKPVLPGQNRRLAGEDFRPGQLVLSKDHRVRAEDILCLAALGITRIEVYKRLRVKIIATGKELVDADQVPHGAEIRNSTTPFLKALFEQRGVDVSTAKVGDDIEAFHRELETEADLILTTGAISVGKWDFVARELAGQTYFQKVKIRPGKPLLFARLESGKFLMALPGNPVATATGFRFFVDPLLRALDHRSHERPVQARLKTATRKTSHTTCFLKAWLDGEHVEPAENQKASITNALLKSNAWIALPENLPETVAAGTLVDVFPFHVSHT